MSIYFCGNRNQPDKINTNHDRLLNIRSFFDNFNDPYNKVYNQPDILAAKLLYLSMGELFFKLFLSFWC